jgi:hypothetical protein
MKWNDPNAKSLQEVRDEKSERDDQAFADMYEVVMAEREAAGLSHSPTIVCAEARRRLRAANP